MSNENRKELHAGAPGEADRSLRLIAGLPAPPDLVERVHDGLRAGTFRSPLRGEVLSWPVDARSARGPMRDLMRGAAAAAIVCIVAGGAWSIYARLTPGVGAGSNAVTVPVPVRPAHGFSSANAIKTPETLQGPVLIQPPQPAQPTAVNSTSKPAKKTTPRTAQKK